MDDRSGSPLGKRSIRYIKVLLSLSFGFFLLWLIGRGQDFDLILQEFRKANYFWVLISMAFAVMSHFIRALRWNVLVDSLGYKTRTWQTFKAVMAGYLSNMAVPRLGEITRCMVLNRLTKAPMNALLGTVVAERVFDLFSLLLIIALTISFQFGFLKAFLYQFFLTPLLIKESSGWWYLAIVTVIFMSIIISAFVFLRKKLIAPVSGGFYYKIKQQLTGLINGLFSIWTIKKKFLFITYSVLIWACYLMTVYICFLAIQATSSLSIQAAITLLAVGSLGIVAPVPGGIGTYHFLTILTLTELYGIANEPAISYAYISHAIQTLVILFAGSYAWIMVSLKDKARHLSGT